MLLDRREGALQSQQHGNQSFVLERGNALGQCYSFCMKPKSLSTVHRGMSAAMQRSLLRLARQQRAVLAAGQRAYASAAELAVAQDSPFLRFASPEPHPVTYGSVLGQIPETQVGRCLALVFRTSQESIDLNCSGLGVQTLRSGRSSAIALPCY